MRKLPSPAAHPTSGQLRSFKQSLLRLRTLSPTRSLDSTSTIALPPSRTRSQDQSPSRHHPRNDHLGLLTLRRRRLELEGFEADSVERLGWETGEKQSC